MSSITYFHPHITALIYASLCYTFIYLFILANVLAWRQHNNMLGSALPVLSKHGVSGFYHCSPEACLNRDLIQSFLSRPALGSVGSLSILHNAVVCRIYTSACWFSEPGPLSYTQGFPDLTSVCVSRWTSVAFTSMLSFSGLGWGGNFIVQFYEWEDV